jgi:hypothetical protein
MTIYIVDNKKLDMIPAEWDMYQSICKSYDKVNFKGESLFHNLFESDDNGQITFIKPPSNRYTSMEVLSYVMILFQHQNMRLMHKRFNSMAEDFKKQINEIKKNK